MISYRQNEEKEELRWSSAKKKKYIKVHLKQWQ